MAPYDLNNRNVLITGGSRGLGALLCHKFAERGCNVAINYVSSESAAKDLATQLESKHAETKIKVTTIQADVGIQADCERLIKEASEALGGLDIIVNNAGWTKFSKFGDLDALSEAEWDKCWSVNVKSQLALLRPAMPILNANPDGGAFLITSSIAGIVVGGSSMAYCVTKAAQLQLMRCLAKTQGPKVRVNAILPGLLLTEWGLKYPEEAIKNLKETAVLKMETDMNDCADAFIMVATNGSMTGQNITVDAGLELAR